MNIVIALMSFIIGGIFGMAIMCCVVVGEEENEKNTRKTKND